MLTKKITYEDFDGNQVTEECQFHLTKSELMKMELSEAGGMYATLEKMVQENNTLKSGRLTVFLKDRSNTETVTNEEGKEEQ